MDHGDSQYEYRSIRHECALFDISPMRKIRISGSDAGSFLDILLTRPVSHLTPWHASYVVFCTEAGYLKDDAMLYKFSDEDYLLLPSDIDHCDYFGQLADTRSFTNITFTECTNTLIGMALQGPCAAAVADEMGFAEARNLEPYEFRYLESVIGDVLVTRMGFTADLGYEFWMSPQQCTGFTAQIDAARRALSLRIPGYGLNALEACRIEGGFVVAGWDFSTELDPQPGFERTPFETGLGWLVDLEGTDFVGQEALSALKANSRFLIRRISTDATGSLVGVPLIANVDNQILTIGVVNCSAWSWGLSTTIGNASVEPAFRDVEACWLDLEDKRFDVQLRRGPHIQLARRDQMPAPLNSFRVD
jgi:aminomethyltransferase